MIQEAVVTGVYDDGTADVAVERAAMCGGDCSKCEACMYENVIKTRAKNPIAAPQGARVHIETDSNQVFLATLAIYALPMLVFFVGYGLARAAGLQPGHKRSCSPLSFWASAREYPPSSSRCGRKRSRCPRSSLR
jgi:positive regulator of sigma E activity